MIDRTICPKLSCHQTYRTRLDQELDELRDQSTLEQERALSDRDALWQAKVDNLARGWESEKAIYEEKISEVGGLVIMMVDTTLQYMAGAVSYNRCGRIIIMSGVGTIKMLGVG